MADKKFSDFTDGGNMRQGDKPVGLRPSSPTQNFIWDFPGDGIQDSNGNFIISWDSVGAAAANYLLFQNSNTTLPVTITADGSDTNIDISIDPKGNGGLILDGLHWPTSDGTMGQFMYTDGAGNLGFTSSSFPLVPGAAGSVIISDGANWVASTTTFSNTYAINSILFASSANTVTGLAPANSAVLTSTSAGVPTWSNSMTNGQVIIGSTGGTPQAANIVGSSGVSVTNGVNSIVISGSGGGYGWTEVTGTSASMAVNNGYVANNAGLVTLTLPAIAAFGDTVKIAGKGAGLFKIAQNAGQTIHVGGTGTTTGVTGSLTSVEQYNSLELLCITANTDWEVLQGLQGNFTIA